LCLWDMEAAMRTTLALDDDLVSKAQAFTGLQEESALVREALKALIERESARRLARLGGSEPNLSVSPDGDPLFDSRRYIDLDRSSAGR
jgi:Arc/MetJ family transcription regulator